MLAGAAVLLTAAVMAPAGALPLDSGAMRPAAEAVNSVDKAACWQWGWNGWGWYPCWGGYYYGGYDGMPYHYGHWGPGYGWRHHHDDNEEDDDHHYWRR